MRTSAADLLQEGWSAAVASDPGLLRLRLAVRAVVAVGLAAAVEHVLGPAVGLPSVVAMLLGGMVGLNGSFAASSRSPADAALTLAAFPVVAGAGALLAASGAGHPVVQRAGYVVVLVAAVWVRRRGPRGFAYGMLAWTTYLFTAFSAFTLPQVPALLAVLASATGCVAAAAAVLVPDRPAATLAAARNSFEARVAALAGTARDVVEGRVPPSRAAARLHARSLRLVEVALVVDGYLASAGSVGRSGTGGPGGPGGPGRSAAEVRAALLHAELAATELASAVARLHGRAVLAAPVRASLRSALDALACRDLLAARARTVRLRDVLARQGGAGDPATTTRARDAAGALEGLLEALDQPAAVPPGIEHSPAVALFQGNLPGTADSATAAITAGTSWWSHRSLNTRLCVQAAVAAPLALLAGQALSPTRYYWALLACFLVLTGTLTTGETATKAANRVAGTVAGLVAATAAVHLTGSRDGPVVAVMLACVFVGLYCFRVSYAVMAFAVTTLMGLLYEVLHEFSDQLLGLRVAETAVGAAVGVAVALLVLPVRTADARAAAQRAFLVELAELLADVRVRLEAHGRTSDLYLDARRLDARLLQLVLVARPAGGPALVGLSSRTAARAVRRWTETAYRARALVAAVAQLEPGARPDLVGSVEALRDHVTGAAGPPGPVRAAGDDAAGDDAAGDDAAGDDAAGDDAARSLADLADAVARLPAVLAATGAHDVVGAGGRHAA